MSSTAFYSRVDRKGANANDDGDMSLPLRQPFTALLAGPTGCGKTRFVFRLVDNIGHMVDPPPTSIAYCYGEYQQLFCEYPDIVFRQGLPVVTGVDGSEPVLLIIDDLMNEVDESVANIFTRGSHHRNVSLILLVQNLFHKSKHVRTISLNSHYFVLYKNPRDASQIANLFRQMYHTRWRFAVEAYKDATREPYSYLLVDLRPHQDEMLRLRTNVFPGETHYVCVPEK